MNCVHLIIPLLILLLYVSVYLQNTKEDSLQNLHFKCVISLNPLLGYKINEQVGVIELPSNSPRPPRCIDYIIPQHTFCVKGSIEPLHF